MLLMHCHVSDMTYITKSVADTRVILHISRLCQWYFVSAMQKMFAKQEKLQWWTSLLIEAPCPWQSHQFPSKKALISSMWLNHHQILTWCWSSCLHWERHYFYCMHSHSMMTSSKNQIKTISNYLKLPLLGKAINFNPSKAIIPMQHHHHELR